MEKWKNVKFNVKCDENTDEEFFVSIISIITIILLILVFLVFLFVFQPYQQYYYI